MTTGARPGQQVKGRAGESEGDEFWCRNHLQFRSKQTLGLSLSPVLLLVENGATVYVFASHPLPSNWIVNTAPIACQTVLNVSLSSAF